MSLSRNYTLKSLMGEIRLKSGKLQNSLLTRGLLIDMIYTCLLDVARELKEADTPEFGTTANVTEITAVGSTNFASFDLTNIDGANTKINVESIVKMDGLADSVVILAIPTDATEFRYLQDYPQKQNDVFWYRDGEKVYLYRGTSITNFGTVTLHYDRVPEKAITDATYIDLSDRFIPLLIGKVLEKIGV